MLKGRHIIESTDLSLEELESLFQLAERIVEAPQRFSDRGRGKILATLFYEPSTRTRFSFEAAMLRLGGQVIGFSEPGSSSAAKGESIGDTIRTVGCYADAAVMRHPKEGAPRLASKFSSIPVINAGDGGHQHPTQTLTDLLTIRRLKGDISNKTIGLCGDLMFGRTVHSLVNALAQYDNLHFVFISPPELTIPPYILEELGSNTYEQTNDLEAVMGKLDILYMTRIQRERFFNEEEYLRLKGYYILDAEKMELAKEDMIVMHPLPRVDEIAPEVDRDPRAVYFQQAKFGMYIRMALIMELLGLGGE
ncbi:aspartate carbamoyltransferase [Anaerotalea alkaliphila]|uniref:Aspartate carbamoyltransferase n=1 Tax=Anaerotalea alkaliphila TaxID=2662126 RepID=A0A7X5KP25_9FIRM|nr:aspartate carbamoyltransferase [Anaerotalea alkaliphila]NDL67412.1 aspartate carbamoyltransferase [Anaerotalea alkaliphila]